ncbi:hypothetical protein LDFHOB_01950 [Candidatus Electronema aureum]
MWRVVLLIGYMVIIVKVRYPASSALLIAFTLFSEWREKRNLLEHQGESALEFYMWRAVLLIGYIVIILTGIFLPVTFMIAAATWPYLSVFAVGIILVFVVCLSGVIILLLLERFEALVLRIELRKRRSLPKAT